MNCASRRAAQRGSLPVPPTIGRASLRRFFHRGAVILSQEIDHDRKRKRRTVSDLTIEDASYKLSDRQFEAWKLAMVHGMSNAEISDTMGDADIVVFPSEVQEALHAAAKRGFAIPGEEYLMPRKRVKVAA